VSIGYYWATVGQKLRPGEKAERKLPIMSDEESYAVDAKAPIGGPLKDGEKPFAAKDLEPFGNEESAEIKYRTMKWW
jgi:hypothetical protein